MVRLTPHMRLFTATFLLDFCVMIGFTVIPFFVYNQLGGDADLSGLFGGLLMLVYAISCLGTSLIVQHYGKTLRWAIAGIIGYFVLFYFTVLFKTPWICILTATSAMGMIALTWPALQSWIGAEPDPQGRAFHVSCFNVSTSFGMALSPLLTGPLYDANYHYPFIAMVVLGMVVLMLVTTLPDEKRYFGERLAVEDEAELAHDRRSEQHLYSAWCALFTIFAVVGIVSFVFPKRLDDLISSHELSLLFGFGHYDFLTTHAATRFGWLKFLLSITSTITFLIMGRTRRWQHNFPLLAGMQLAAAAGIFLLGFTNSLLVMMLCFVLIGATQGVAFCGAIYYSLSNPLLKHRRAAITEGCLGLGIFSGSAGFGYLAAYVGQTVSFLATPLLILISIMVQALLLRYQRHKLGMPPAITVTPMPQVPD